MKTLYVSDLDETLLRHDERLSDFTVQSINTLIEKGMVFSFATARSALTAREVTKGLSPRLPIIVYNGTFIVEQGTQRKLHSVVFSPTEVKCILDVLLAHGLSPFVRALTNEQEAVRYRSDRITRAMQKYLDRRIGDQRLTPIRSNEDLLPGEVFCFTCMDDKSRLLPALEELEREFRCLFFKDVYTDEWWLEIQPTAATKANAVLALKDLMACDRVVCFGNGENDISMFGVADECYAVENAHPSLKAIATNIIPSCDEDGVAKWLLKNYR